MATLINTATLTKMEIFPMFKQNISRIYPEAQGWKVYNRFNWVTYLHDFVVQREVEGQIERVVVEVNTESHMSVDQIQQFGQVADRLTGTDTTVIKKILVIAQNANVQDIPEDIEVFYLNAFLMNGVAAPINGAAQGGNSDKMVA